MTTTIAMLTLDCAEVTPVADFWKAALGYEQLAGDGESYAMLKGETGPALGLGKVEDYQPPGWPNEHGSKQFHLDLAAVDVDAEAERLVGLGATLADPRRCGGGAAGRARRHPGRPAAGRDLAGAARPGRAPVLCHERGQLGLAGDYAVTSRSLVTVAIGPAGADCPLLSSPRNRAREYVAGWVERMNSCTIFANRCGWSL
jgi:hypothetical protein